MVVLMFDIFGSWSTLQSYENYLNYLHSFFPEYKWIVSIFCVCDNHSLLKFTHREVQDQQNAQLLLNRKGKKDFIKMNTYIYFGQLAPSWFSVSCV